MARALLDGWRGHDGGHDDRASRGGHAYATQLRAMAARCACGSNRDLDRDHGDDRDHDDGPMR